MQSVRQQKQERRCPECNGPLKRTIGAVSRAKFLECVDKGAECFRRKASEFREA
jgi:ssDNA-binding Zn-finger/Zn-ribbon topoisomerase 1